MCMHFTYMRLFPQVHSELSSSISHQSGIWSLKGCTAIQAWMDGVLGARGQLLQCRVLSPPLLWALYWECALPLDSRLTFSALSSFLPVNTPSLTLIACDALLPHSGTFWGFLRPSLPKFIILNLAERWWQGRGLPLTCCLPLPPSPPIPGRAKTFSTPRSHTHLRWLLFPHPRGPAAKHCFYWSTVSFFFPGSESSMFHLPGLVLRGWEISGVNREITKNENYTYYCVEILLAPSVQHEWLQAVTGRHTCKQRWFLCLEGQAWASRAAFSTSHCKVCVVSLSSSTCNRLQRKSRLWVPSTVLGRHQGSGPCPWGGTACQHDFGEESQAVGTRLLHTDGAS